MAELSDEERLLVVDRVSELTTLDEEQLSILSDKAMNCQRGDVDFQKLKTLGIFWRRHREGLVSLANFDKQVNKACGLTEPPPPPPPRQQHQGKQVSAGEEEDLEEDLEDDQNGAADIGENDDADGGAGGGGAEQDNGAEDEDAAIKKIVDNHIQGGFFEPRRWKTSKTLVCPGDGYWKDDHRIKEFRTSTVDDLKVAEPRPRPIYINRNPYCAQAPKRVFDYNMDMYALCKKVAVSSEGKIFRATDKEIEAALKKTSSRAPTGIASAEGYVEMVCEARRRHLLAQEVEEEEEEEEEEETEDAVTVRDGEEENGDSGGDACEEDGEEEEEEEEGQNRADRVVKKIVGKHLHGGFLARRRWRRTIDFTRPGSGYWRDDHDEHRIKVLRDATAADLRAAEPRPAPVYINKNPFCSKQPKQKYDNQLGMYYLCRKVAVSFDGKIFRAPNKDIETALKQAHDVPAGLSAETYLRVVQEMHRRHSQEQQQQQQKQQKQPRHEEEEEEEEEEEGDDDDDDDDRMADWYRQEKRTRIDIGC